jgi:hypothetical protein
MWWTTCWIVIEHRGQTWRVTVKFTQVVLNLRRPLNLKSTAKWYKNVTIKYLKFLWDLVTENLKNLLFSKINSEKPIDNFLSQKGRLLNHPPVHHPFETSCDSVAVEWQLNLGNLSFYFHQRLPSLYIVGYYRQSLGKVGYLPR